MWEHEPTVTEWGFSISGTSDVWGLGRLLLPGGVGEAEPRAEGSVRRRHAGELPAPVSLGKAPPQPTAAL